MNTAINQDFAIDFFRRAFANGKMTKAYLLAGNCRQDKDKLVMRVNQLLNCKQVQYRDSLPYACGECQNCKWISSETHPKTPLRLKPGVVLEEDEDGNLVEQVSKRSSVRPTIKIDSIRPLKIELLQSSVHTFRVVVVEDADSSVLIKNSSAALLKIVEEAPDGVMFIFFADSKEQVLPTIVSRTQVVTMKNNVIENYSDSAKELSDELLAWIVSEQASSRLAQIEMAEKLAANESELLLESLHLTADHYAQEPKIFFAFDDAINALGSYVRPRNLFVDLFRKIV